MPLLGKGYRERHGLATSANSPQQLVRLEVRTGDVSEGPRAAAPVPRSFFLLPPLVSAPSVGWGLEREV